jgi:hypothetical protein
MLATLLVLPGGLMLLASVAFVVVLMRTERGQRLLVPLKRRVPPRIRANAKRVLALVAGEKLFPSGTRAVHSTTTQQHLSA